MAQTIQLGDRFVVVNTKLSSPCEGTVIAITQQPGKLVGLELDEPKGIHSCDGRCKDKHGLWVRPKDLMTPEQFRAKVSALSQQSVTFDDNGEPASFG